jgi:hypothetical protein
MQRGMETHGEAVSTVMRFSFVAAGILTVSLASPALGQVNPPTLTGESFVGAGSVSVVAGCTASSTGGAFTYFADGTALGPYPGTFTEQGTVTIGSSAVVTSFSATFTISSGTTTITGTKQLPTPSPLGGCFPAFAASVFPTYSATITTPAGRFHDEGMTSVAAIFPEFGEPVFTSSLSQTVPFLPATKGACTAGGFGQFGVFKNQGDCVSFVANGGKNPSH